MNSLAPAFLLSMPQLADPNFTRTVVLLCEHTSNGAFGIVLNRPVVTSGRVVVNLDPPMSIDHELQVWCGGPVEPQRCWVLSDEPADDDSHEGVRITDRLWLATSAEALRRCVEPHPAALSRLIVGYAGWGPGQLEAELRESSWLLSDVDADLIFRSPSDQMWERAIRRLGADPATLQMSRGVH